MQNNLNIFYKKQFLKSLEKVVKHNLREGQLYHRLRRIRQIFVVDSKPSDVFQPSEGSSHNPPFGQNQKFGWAIVGSENYFYRPSEFVCYPIAERALIPSVGKYLDKARKLVSSFSITFGAPLLSLMFVSWTVTAIGSPSV